MRCYEDAEEGRYGKYFNTTHVLADWEDKARRTTLAPDDIISGFAAGPDIPPDLQQSVYPIS